MGECFKKVVDNVFNLDKNIVDSQPNFRKACENHFTNNIL
jgi:hypothetical protein